MSDIDAERPRQRRDDRRCASRTATAGVIRLAEPEHDARRSAAPRCCRRAAPGSSRPAPPARAAASGAAIVNADRRRRRHRRPHPPRQRHAGGAAAHDERERAGDRSCRGSTAGSRKKPRDRGGRERPFSSRSSRAGIFFEIATDQCGGAVAEREDRPTPPRRCPAGTETPASAAGPTAGTAGCRAGNRAA